MYTYIMKSTQTNTLIIIIVFFFFLYTRYVANFVFRGASSSYNQRALKHDDDWENILTGKSEGIKHINIIIYYLIRETEESTERLPAVRTKKWHLRGAHKNRESVRKMFLFPYLHGNVWKVLNSIITSK